MNFSSDSFFSFSFDQTVSSQSIPWEEPAVDFFFSLWRKDETPKIKIMSVSSEAALWLSLHRELSEGVSLKEYLQTYGPEIDYQMI